MAFQWHFQTVRKRGSPRWASQAAPSLAKEETVLLTQIAQGGKHDIGGATLSLSNTHYGLPHLCPCPWPWLAHSFGCWYQWMSLRCFDGCTWRFPTRAQSAYLTLTLLHLPSTSFWLNPLGLSLQGSASWEGFLGII